MTVSRMPLLLVVLLWAGSVSADGYDFANNLFSDLAPLLALFGERVTMQFMSGAMGWADTIILAMAPLGIITAIVGAIRVGGPTWLKAVIGRARENLAVAEAELMSSTSQEVCELWNGQEIVRCMGSPSVTEFICLLPKNTSKGAPEVVVQTSQKALKDQNDHLEQIDLNIKNGIYRRRDSRENQDPEKSLASPCQNIIVTRNHSLDAPNIYVNAHQQTSREKLRVVAAFGTILQLCVLLYSRFATYHPTLKFQKDGSPIESYAYPCTAVGTLILVLGMILCAHVVDNSTTEERYQPKPEIDMKVRMVWLQQTKIVSDQVFGSFVIYATNDQPFITTSRRTQKVRGGRPHPATRDGKHSTSDDSNNVSATAGEAASLTLQVKTVLGMMTALTGFVLQFVGLRGLHWSASVAQLGAVLVMLGLKAWVRRGLATPPKAISLPPGYELDWFAKTLGEVGQAPWNSEATPGTETEPTGSGKELTSEWMISCCGDAHLGPKKRDECQGDEQSDQLSDISHLSNEEAAMSRDSERSVTGDVVIADAQRVLKIRKDHGYLAKWQGNASAEAVSLARAIEITMNALIGSSTAIPGTFYWSLDASYDGTGNCPINFEIARQPDGKWKAFANEYEAALSLWLSSANDETKKAARLSEQNKGKASGPSLENEKGTEHRNNKKDNARLRMEESKGEMGLRVVGSHTTALRRDLQWWVPKDLLRIFGIKKHQDHQQLEETQESGSSAMVRKILTGKERVMGPRSLKAQFDSVEQNDLDAAPFLAAESYSSTPLLFAQHMFSAFMYAVAGTKEKEELFQGVADVQPAASGATTWKSFTLQNATITAMVQEMETSGLGTLADIYLSVIPPLSEMKKLPRVDDAIIEVARAQAKQHEQLQHWKEATDIYLWLFQTANTFKGQDIVAKATTVLLEYLRQVVSTINLRKDEGQFILDPLSKAAYNIQEILKESADHQILLNLMELYESQDRQWECEAIYREDAQPKPETSYRQLKAFNFTKLHEAVRDNSMDQAEEAVKDPEMVNAKDIHRWTSLHYAARTGNSRMVWRLLNNGAEVNSLDLNGYTPFHYACRSKPKVDGDGNASDEDRRRVIGNPIREAAGSEEDRERAIGNLILEGADVNAQGRDGMTPLHCASIEGNERIVSVLIEAGANANISDASGSTPLFLAARMGGTQYVQNLWEVTGKRLRDNFSRDSLHLAALSGNTDLTEWLLTQASDKEVKDRRKYRPLHWAARNGHEDVVKLLIKHGVEIKAKDQMAYTPLHKAAEGGHEGVIELLIDNGAEPKAETLRGGTPLHEAAKGGHVGVVNLLLQRGAELNVQDQKGITPLHKAAEGGHEDVVKLLIDKGADINPRGTLGNFDRRADDLVGRESLLRPLHCAVRHGQTNIARILMEKGASTETPDDKEPTLLSLAIGRGDLEFAKELIKGKSDVLDQRHGRNLKWKTPLLHMTARNGHADIVKFLIDMVDKQCRDERGKTAQQVASERRQEAAESGALEIWKGREQIRRTVKDFDEVISLLK
ncbi:hypothetical protein CSUB01_08487 [Colletotrichum sublineola]|uniref:Uncharacterized protein n=1 Tax=Colletotrichum sublineola TaxID=1173701 RepID=A0A066X1B5_COLSU|nr:hypothetical protein CSUB01_08487 [Colletotrichum sublineola]